MFHTETKREQKKWTGAGRENRLSGIIWAVCSKLLRTVSKQRRNLRGVCECKCGKCLLRDFLPRGSSTAAKNTPYFSRHFPDVFCVTSKDKHTHTVLQGLFRQTHHKWILGILLLLLFLSAY